MKIHKDLLDALEILFIIAVVMILAHIITMPENKEPEPEPIIKKDFSVHEVVKPKPVLNYTTKEFRVTAYCPGECCCGDWADGRFADNSKVGGLAVAADRSIPLGTMIDIPDYGLAEVKDRGGAIKGTKLDVYFDTHQEALNWGKPDLMVKIYE